MHKGIYIATSGAVLKQNHIDLIAQNLANVNTIGYRREYLTFADYLINEVNKVSDDKIMTKLNKKVFDFSKGEFVNTGKPLDIAIEGEGFISLEGNRYTRRGDLTIDKNGYLVNFKGYKVLGNNGEINVGTNVVPEISSDGKVWVNGHIIDEIKVVDFERYDSFIKIDSCTFKTDEIGSKIKINILNGYLETSNVSPVYEMISMIEAMRDFESYQKAIQIFDESTNKIVNELARI